MSAISKLAKLAAGFRGTFTVGDDVGIAYEPSPDDADGDGPRVTFQQAVVDLLNAIGPALAEVAALARHKTAAGPAESVHAALGVSSREAAIAAMDNGVPCPTCGAESAAAPCPTCGAESAAAPRHFSEGEIMTTPHARHLAEMRDAAPASASSIAIPHGLAAEVLRALQDGPRAAWQIFDAIDKARGIRGGDERVDLVSTCQALIDLRDHGMVAGGIAPYTWELRR